MADRVERLTNLLALLLETSEPLSLVEIAAELDGQYPATGRRATAGVRARQAGAARSRCADRHRDPRRRAVRRSDPVPDRSATSTNSPISTSKPTRCRRCRWPSPPCAPGRERGRSAIWKLGGALDDEQPPVSARVPDRPELPVIRAAVASRSAITFVYRGTERHLDPWGLLLRGGFWYVVGHDHDRAEQRTFRVDRFDGGASAIVVGTARSVRTPCRLRSPVGVPGRPEADRAVRPTRRSKPPCGSTRAGRRPPCGNSVTTGCVRRHDDGSIDVRVPADNLDAFRSWVLGLLEHAVVVDPPELRASIVTGSPPWPRPVPGTGDEPGPTADGRGAAAAAARDAPVADGGRRGRRSPRWPVGST